MELTKRDNILQAASKAFARFGFRKASVGEIARSAGVAKGTIYLACQSKEDLLYQALHRELRSWTSACAMNLDPRKPADELMEELVQEAIKNLEGYPLVKDLFLGHFHKLLPDWRHKFNELLGIGRAQLEELLRLGIRQGRFREDLDIENTAVLLQDLHLAAHLFHEQELEEHPERLDPRIKAGLSLVLRGLLRAP